VEHFEFTFWEWTFNETSFAIAKLADFIVSPSEESSIVKNGHAMSLATNKL
jgi:hypothetical protein